MIFMPGIGHSADIDVDARKALIQEQITLLVGNQRSEQALKAAELGQLYGIHKALLLRNGLLISAVRHCRLNPNADSRMPVLTFITFCADNDEGVCYLSVTRMCEIFKRSRETITKAINSLEAQGQIGVKRKDGMPSYYWPLIPAGLVDLFANPIWLVNALSDKPAAKVRTTAEMFGDATGQVSPTGADATNRSDIVDEPVKDRGLSGQASSSRTSLFTSLPTSRGQSPQRQGRSMGRKTSSQRSYGQAEMNMALSGEAAYAERNIILSESGRLSIGDEFKVELLEVFSERDIEDGVNSTLAAMGVDRNKMRILQQVRRQSGYARRDNGKAAAYVPRKAGITGRSGKRSF